MITLALFNRIASDGVAGLQKNVDFFWEEYPLQKDGKPPAGVWIITRGGDASAGRRGKNLQTTVDFYVCYNLKARTEQIQQEILEWILQNACICSLEGSAGDIQYSYENIRIRPTTTPENAGATINDNIVKMASARIIYNLTNYKGEQ